MKAKLSSQKMGTAIVTFPKLTTWHVMNLFKCFLVGTFGTWDKRFSSKISTEYGIQLLFLWEQLKVKVKIVDKAIDITRPFYTANNKHLLNIYEVYIWSHDHGFVRLVTPNIAPIVTVQQMNYQPEFIVVLNYGHDKQTGKQWCTISCKPWSQQVYSKPMDWHDKLAALTQAHGY